MLQLSVDRAPFVDEIESLPDDVRMSPNFWLDGIDVFLHGL